MPRPIKPAAWHELQGTKSQAKSGLTPESGRPPIPKISGKARRVCKQLCVTLEKRRALTPGDEEILRLYSHLYDRHLKALAKLTEEGEIRIYYRLDSHGEQCATEKPNLWLRVAETCEAKMHAILRDLGLTPSSRKNIQPTEAPAVNTLDALMRQHAELSEDEPTPPEDVNLDDIDLEQIQ